MTQNMDGISVQFGRHVEREERADRIEAAFQKFALSLVEAVDGLPNAPDDPEEFIESIEAEIDQFLDEEADGNSHQDRYLYSLFGGAALAQCSQRDIPLPGKEIVEILEDAIGEELSSSELVFKRKRELDHCVEEWRPQPAVEVFIERYADELDIPERAQQAAIDVDIPDSSGRSNNVLAAAAIWMNLLKSDDILQDDLADVARVSNVQLRKAVDDLS